MSSFFDDFLNEMNLANLQSQGQLSIIEFANRIIFNGDTDFQLYPTQKAILKAFYNEPLEPDEQTILQQWVDDERSTWVPDRPYISLVLEAGRRASKCNAASAIIPTTEGDLTYLELHNMLQDNKKVGIYTYDFDSKIVKSYITYDLKSELNQVEKVYEIKTETGKTETTNSNHPFLTYRKGDKKPTWRKLEELKVGERIATSGEVPVFGTKDLSDKEAEIAALFICFTNRRGKLLTPLKKYQTYSILNKHFNSTEYQFNQGSISINSDYMLNFYNNLNPSIFFNLSKESTIKLLKYICQFSWSLDTDDDNKHLRSRVEVNTKFKDVVLRSFNKLGITFINCKRYLELRNTNTTHNFFNIFGWDFTNDSRTVKEAYGEIGIVPKYYLEDRIPEGLFTKDFVTSKKAVLTRSFVNITESMCDLCNNNINWESIVSVTCKGTEQTIALEVKGTHVIGSHIISHNSTMASIIALKEFYDLIIMDNPHKHYKMFTGSPIAILVMAQSQAQVKETIFAAIRGYAENSNFFTALKNIGKIEILSEEIRCQEKNVAIYAKHTNSKSLVGYTLKCMLLDEVARFETTGEEGKNKAFEIWRNVAAGGAAFGTSFKKVAISSAWEPGDPIEVLYEDAKKDPNTLGFKLTTFQVNLQLIKGVTPVIVSDYTTDFVKARREYEGVRFSKFNTFIDIINLKRSATGVTCLDAIPHQIDIKTAAGERHYAGIKILRLAPNPDPSELSFIHIDPALKKDSAALAIARPTKVNDKWCISVDGLLKWEPHTDDNGLRRVVSFLDIEERLNDIIPARHVKRVTFDQWNSAAFIQKLHSQGIDSQQVSCSREMQFSYYTLFRDLLAHDYIILPRDSRWSNEAITELSELVMKPNKQIIHPYAGKDLADAIVNAIFQCHQYMVRVGLNITTGLNTGVVKSSRLASVTRFNQNHLEIGTAIDKLYNRKK